MLSHGNSGGSTLTMSIETQETQETQDPFYAPYTICALIQSLIFVQEKEPKKKVHSREKN